MPASPPPRKLVIALVAVGVFMATLDSSIVNVSLPSMARYFGVPLGPAVEWVVMAYLVVVAALLLTVGRLADLFGHKVVWAAGLVLFTAASALCGARRRSLSSSRRGACKASEGLCSWPSARPW